MTTINQTNKTFVYRGVTYNPNNNAEVNPKTNTSHVEKIYRAAKYFRIPDVKHVIADHVYRGTHYFS